MAVDAQRELEISGHPIQGTHQRLAADLDLGLAVELGPHAARCVEHELDTALGEGDDGLAGSLGPDLELGTAGRANRDRHKGVRHTSVAARGGSDDAILSNLE